MFRGKPTHVEDPGLSKVSSRFSIFVILGFDGLSSVVHVSGPGSVVSRCCGPFCILRAIFDPITSKKRGCACCLGLWHAHVRQQLCRGGTTILVLGNSHPFYLFLPKKVHLHPSHILLVVFDPKKLLQFNPLQFSSNCPSSASSAAGIKQVPIFSSHQLK